MSMNSMTLSQTYNLKIAGLHIDGMRIKSEWNGFIELEGGPNRGKIIVRRKGWNNGKHWLKEANAFMEQELEILYADTQFNLPETEVIFVKPEKEGKRNV